MSKSLKIVNGDLAVGQGRGYAIVDGRSKLMQDLSLWILERIGTDPSYPTYGSRLDGGIIDGRAVEGFIGQSISAERVLEIRNEVVGVLTQYQSLQLEKIKRDAIDFNGRQTIAPEEVFYLIENVEARAFGDTVVVRVTIRTLANTLVKVTIPVQA